MKQKNKTIQIEPSSEAPPTIVDDKDNPASDFTNIASTLSEIRKIKDVTGYILRSNTEAIIDITPNESLVEYASLSSQVHDASLAISKQFNLTDIESVLVEGKSTKVLCMSIGENRMAVFMDKTCTHTSIVKRILL